MIRDHGAWLRRYVTVLAPAAEIDDVMQTIWVKVCRSIDQRRDESATEAWLKRIAFNTVSTMSDSNRRRFRRDAAEARATVAVDRAAEAVVLDRADGDRALRALAALSAADRELIERRHVLEESHADLAAEFAVTPGALRTRLSRALENYRLSYERLSVVIGAFLLRLRRRAEQLGLAPDIGSAQAVAIAALLTVIAAPTPSVPAASGSVSSPATDAVVFVDPAPADPSLERVGDRESTDIADPSHADQLTDGTRPADAGPGAATTFVELPTGGGVRHQPEADPDPDASVGHPAVGTVDVYVQRYVDEIGATAPDAPGDAPAL